MFLSIIICLVPSFSQVDIKKTVIIQLLLSKIMCE